MNVTQKKDCYIAILKSLKEIKKYYGSDLVELIKDIEKDNKYPYEITITKVKRRK